MNLIFVQKKGDYVKNKRHGKGLFYYPDGSKYDGEWNENVREGHGTYTYPNNDTYEGAWNNGKRQGPGEMQFGQYRYIGKFNENYVCDRNF
jgi:radial spoke head protein 1